MEIPCRPDCPRRRADCHPGCPEYKEFRASLDRQNAEKRKERDVYAYRKQRREQIAEIERANRARGGYKGNA